MKSDGRRGGAARPGARAPHGGEPGDAIVVVLAWFQTTTHPWARAIPGWVSLGAARTPRRASRPRGGSRYPGTAAWYSVNWLACSMKAWPTIGPSTESVWIHIADSTKLYEVFP